MFSEWWGRQLRTLWPIGLLVFLEVTDFEIGATIDFVANEATRPLKFILVVLHITSGDVIIERPESALQESSIVETSPFVIGISPQQDEVEACRHAEGSDCFTGGEGRLY